MKKRRPTDAPCECGGQRFKTAVKADGKRRLVRCRKCGLTRGA